MKVYVLSVLLVKVEEDGKEEVRGCEPIAVYTDRNKAVSELNRYVDEEESENRFPIVRTFRNKDVVSGSAESVCDNKELGLKWKETLSLKTIDTDKEIDFTDEIGSLW